MRCTAGSNSWMPTKFGHALRYIASSWPLTDSIMHRGQPPPHLGCPNACICQRSSRRVLLLAVCPRRNLQRPWLATSQACGAPPTTCASTDCSGSKWCLIGVGDPQPQNHQNPSRPRLEQSKDLAAKEYFWDPHAAEREAWHR